MEDREMKFCEAMHIVLDLAMDNTLDERDAMDEKQRQEAEKQETATDIMYEWFKNNCK